MKRQSENWYLTQATIVKGSTMKEILTPKYADCDSIFWY